MWPCAGKGKTTTWTPFLLLDMLSNSKKASKREEGEREMRKEL